MKITPVVTGIRCWDITDDGRLWSPFRDGNRDPQDDVDYEWSPGWNVATCETHRFPPPPAAGCVCGLRAMLDLDEFLHPVRLGEYIPKVVGRCQLGGPVLGPDDVEAAQPATSSTRRGRWARVASPVVVPAPFAVAWQAVADLYRVHVITTDQHQPNYWTSGGFLDGLAEDLAAYDARELPPDRLVKPRPTQTTKATKRKRKGRR